MKKISFLTVATMLGIILSTYSSRAQFMKRLGQTIKNKVENRADTRTGEATDKAMDKVENGIKGGGNHNSSNNPNDEAQTSAATGNNDGSVQPTLTTYKNYDFVPGDTVIFASNLSDEQTGEIPSQFTLIEGQMDVQDVDGEHVIRTVKGPTITFTPRMSTANYMPDQFTVEFDIKNQAWGLNHFNIDFGHRVYYSGGEGILPGIRFTDEDVTWSDIKITGPFPEPLKKMTGSEHPMTWHHVAIAINKNQGKVYIDEYRVINVNNLSGKPNNVTFNINGYEDSYIKNIRIAAGGIDIYKKVTTESRIIMHGILFDIDKATLKPESMGSINQIFNLMQKDPSLKFEIGGHTDNTGNADHNLTLSQQRADAVKEQLVKMGIDASRLTTKGYGDTKPIDTNDTPEGRANNRRVEFIKM